MFLTQSELALASGRKRPKAQLRWALKRGFVADETMTDADGRPLVLRSIFERTERTSPQKPRWDAIHGQA